MKHGIDIKSPDGLCVNVANLCVLLVLFLQSLYYTMKSTKCLYLKYWDNIISYYDK